MQCTTTEWTYAVPVDIWGGYSYNIEDITLQSYNIDPKYPCSLSWGNGICTYKYTIIYIYIYYIIYTLWLFNIAMENHNF